MAFNQSRCLHGVFQVRGEEGLRSCGPVVHPYRVVSKRDGHDVSDGTEDRSSPSRKR
jgi:hypothetical protein